MTDTIVVIGKKTTRQSERAALETVGKALHRRGKQLITTRGEQGSVSQIIANAYQAAGGTPKFMTATDYKEITGGDNVIAFTDTKYVALLDEKDPDWRQHGWLIIHNPKATQEAATYLVQLLADWDTPIEASA